MSTSVNTIKRLLWILLGVFILTYIISFNLENNLIKINTKWLSNNFLFTIASGAFASLATVLVCEFIRYRQIKQATETAFLIYLGNLYGQFLAIKSNCQRALNSHDAIADNLIQPISNNATLITDQILGIDYTPFCNNEIKDILDKFKTENHLAIKNALNGFIFYRIAFNEDKISLIKQSKREIVTSGCPNVNKTLNKIINQTIIIISYLDQIISQIDNELENKYDWHNKKKALIYNLENYTSQNLNDYLKEHYVVF